MAKWLGVIAVMTPLVQTALMGFIGYPLSRRRPDGTERFRRSGFTWWFITLGVVVVSGIVLAPDLLAPDSPSRHDPLGGMRVLLSVLVGVVVVLAIETLGAEALKRSTSGSVARGRQRYESALPGWVSTGRAEASLLATTGVLEEAVYRGLLIGSLMTSQDLPVAAVAGISAVAFAAAHWYYGWAQMALKLLSGSVLVSVALSAGWMAAAAVHLLLNLLLTVRSRRAPLRQAGS